MAQRARACHGSHPSGRCFFELQSCLDSAILVPPPAKEEPVIRRTIALGASVLILILAIHVPASTQAGGGVDKAMLERVAAAWSTMDVAKAAPFYAKDPDLVFYDVAPLKYVGWSAYAKGSAETFKTLKSATMKLTDDVQVHNAGNTAWTTATLRVEMIPNNGNRMVMTPRWSTVWERRGASWLIVHEHFSMALPDAPPPSGDRK
jgi:ketosteroid isomerase-like protein